jgi:hypothetical protein
MGEETGMTETLEKPLQGQLSFPGEIRRYILGGNSTFTLVSKKTGKRFTYKVQSGTREGADHWTTNNQDRTVFFVRLLNGPDNSNDFVYIGLLKQQWIDKDYHFIHTAKSRVLPGSPSFDGFAYVWKVLENGCHWPKGVEFWHEGSCCICGRKLTVPESVADGIGPECKGKVGL